MKFNGMYFLLVSKWVVTIFFGLFLSNSLSAKPAENKLWFPDFVEAKIVSEAMDVNGVNMKIWEISSKKPSSFLQSYYKNIWSSEPGFLHYKSNQWLVNGYIEGRYFVSLQLLDKQLDSFGFLTISTYPDRKPSAQTKNVISLPPGSQLMTNIYAEDGPHNSRTVTFTNTHSLDANVNFFRQHYKNKHWVEDDMPGIITSNKTLLFRNGPDNATISINNLGKNVGGVAVLVEH